MTGAENPESILPAVTAPPPAPTPLPAPTPSPPTQTERPRRRRSWITETVLAVLVVAFAFLAASFVARNADIWLHMATGRLLAHGQYNPFGRTDPFAYTTAHVPWINHAWLFDWIVYLLYREKADAWLVVGKAALIAVLAGLMLLIRRPGKPGWIPAFCTALAVLAMSPQLLLQPRCVSVMLVGVTFWLLWRCRAPADPSAKKPRLPVDARALLIPLCILWVNLDDWFLLGPLLVGLFWIGDLMRPAAPSPPTPLPRSGGEGSTKVRPTPWWLFPACLAACLCSPYHVFGFSLPADLYPLPFAGGLLQDPRFRLLWASPWQFDAALRSPAGANIAGLAYFVLVALGVASFAVNRSGLRDWRILVWVVFALLGGWSVRLIPFFAVVGGPIAALNWQGMTWELRPTVLKWLRAACVAFLLAVIALALPGWLHGFNQKNMQVAWGVEINPSLRRAAETLYRWRQDGRLGEAERSFCLHPDAACYCAWFGPKDHPEKFRGEKSFVDARFSLFSGAADDYVAVCRGLDPSLAPGVPLARPGPNWREVLSDHHVAVAVLYVPEPGSVLSVLGPLYDNSGDWTLLSIDGQAAIVGWNPARNDYFPQLRFDPGRLAFGPPDEEAPPAPGRGPGRDPYEPGLLSHLGRPAVPAWESAAAQVEMMLFKDPYTPDQRRANDRVYLTSGGGFAGLPGLLAGGGAPAGLSAAVRTVAIQDIRTELLEKPPDLALLAVRAARRAIAADPDDANAYFQLAQAYLALHNETAEHSHSAGYAPLAMLRHVQIVTALRQALILNPDLEAAHQFLADQYLEMRPTPFRDLALEHRSAQLQLARRFGRGATESADAFKQRISQIEAQELSLRNQVQDARELCVIRFKSIGDDPLAKARTALDLGLASTALDDVLMKARVEVYGADVAHQELELLVLTGRSREAKDLLDEEQMRVNKVKLMTYNVAFGGDAGAAYVFPTYEWLLACAGAAVGDYDQAEAALEVTEAFLEARQLAHPAAYAGSVAADVGAPAGGVPGPAALAWLGRRMKQTQALYEEAYHSQQVQRADVLTLTALLDLERGAPDKALRRFQRSIALSRSLLDAGDDVPGAALARELQQRLAAGR